jgi:deoxyribose-phosphate aldolase
MKSYELPPIPSLDAGRLEVRAAVFAGPGVQPEDEGRALELLVSLIDLTTLESTDTPVRVRELCRKALDPLPGSTLPPVAAVCVWPTLVRGARECLRESAVRVASVAGAFPSGRGFVELKLEEVRRAIGEGADEIDYVIDRAAFLAGEFARLYEELVRVVEACGTVRLKVILETGELASHERIYGASRLALDAGADFIKTSTGKSSPAATLPATLSMVEALRDHRSLNGRSAGLKVAGGLRSFEQARPYLELASHELGTESVTPERFRIGASSLLDDLTARWRRLQEREG